jgi:hypothetical protein
VVVWFDCIEGSSEASGSHWLPQFLFINVVAYTKTKKVILNNVEIFLRADNRPLLNQELLGQKQQVPVSMKPGM